MTIRRAVPAAVLAGLLLVGTAGAAGAAGDLDVSFGTAGAVTTVIGDNSSSAAAVAAQSDGKIVVFGQSDYAPGQTGFTLARYLSTGALDTSFGTGGIVTTPVETLLDEAEAGIVQGDGKIVAAGYTSQNGDTGDHAFAVVRYLADGSLDTSFGTGGKAIVHVGTLTGSETAQDVAQQPDGKLVVTGYAFYNPGGGSTAEIATIRLNADGSLDSSFGTAGVAVTPIHDTFSVPVGAGGQSIALLPSGEVVVAYSDTLGDGLDAVAYTPSGQLDTAFGQRGFFHYPMIDPNGWLTDTSEAVVYPNGDVVVAGNRVATRGGGFVAAAMTPAGAIDTSMFVNGMAATATASDFGSGGDYRSGLTSLLADGDGRLVFAGWTGPTGARRFQLVRIEPNGAYDETFGCHGITNPELGGAGTSWVLTDAVLDTDGNIVAGGTVVTNGTESDVAVARFLAAGAAGQCPSSGGGGGGGGGGGASVPNLAVRIVPSATAVPAGGAVDFSVYVDNNGGAGSLLTHLAITVPAGDTLVAPPYYERGSGCTGTTTIDCNLDYIPNGSTTKVAFELRMTGAPGVHTVAAVASSDRESDPSDNSASVAVQVGTASPPPPPPTPSPGPKPHGKTFRGTRRNDVVVGTPYADVLSGAGGNDRLSGRGGHDVLSGGAGNDVLDGGPGADSLSGGAGADTIHARDGVRDTVSCGPGRDIAYVDRRDRVSGCEIVRRR